MLSSLINTTHDWMMSGMAHIDLAKHTRSDDIWRGMPSSILGKTRSRTTSGVTYHLCPYPANIVEKSTDMACHHHLWEAYTVGRRRVWHAIMALGQHTWSHYVGRGRLSSPLGSIHRVGQCWAWHAIIALGKHTWSDNVRHGILSSSLHRTHDQTISRLAML